jgi:hypothetical protein
VNLKHWFSLLKKEEYLYESVEMYDGFIIVVMARSAAHAVKKVKDTIMCSHYCLDASDSHLANIDSDNQ